MESIDNDNKLCSNENIIIRLLNAGLFDYLQTITIIQLLTSSRTLNHFKGILIIMIHYSNLLIITAIRNSTRYS